MIKTLAELEDAKLRYNMQLDKLKKAKLIIAQAETTLGVVVDEAQTNSNATTRESAEESETQTGGDDKLDATTKVTAVDSTAVTDAEDKLVTELAEQNRVTAITKLCEDNAISASMMNTLIESGITLDVIRPIIAEASANTNTPIVATTSVEVDDDVPDVSALWGKVVGNK